MFIQTEATPNPSTMKFLPGKPVAPGGSVDIRSHEEANIKSPLAARLFGLQGVRGVFLGQDFISVSKADDTDWSMLRPMVLGALMEHLSLNMLVLNATQEVADSGPEDEITLQIKELINTRVRPAVAQDGGDIVFHRFEDGIVYLEMRGACAGCPSSTMTLKSGIENMLRHYIPEVREVRAADTY